MRARLARIVPLVALTLLAACASGFNADVKRFQALPPPSGQTFTIQAKDPAKTGSLEFQTYAGLVRDQLTREGFQPAATAAAATLVVNLDYGVDKGREKVVTRPGTGFGSGFGYGFAGYPFYYRLNGQIVRPYGYAWRDPFFWGNPWDYPEVTSYTVYDSYLDVRINRSATNESVFEGRAEARTPSNDLTKLVPNLVAAMFTDFPGQSGVKQRVTVPKERPAS